METVHRIDNGTRILISQAIGLKRQFALLEFWRSRYRPEDGYAVKFSHKSKKKEPDIIIYKDRVPFMVVEVKNYKLDGYMMGPTFNRAIKSLTQYNCYRLLVVSSEDNLRVRKMIPNNNTKYYYYNNISHTKMLLEANGINVLVLGVQDSLTSSELDSVIEATKKDGKVKGWIDVDEDVDD